MKISENAEYLLRERYLLKNKNGDVIETPSQLFNRVAKAIAEVELKYGKSKDEVKKLKREFVKIMSNLDALPNSPTLFNAGTELSQLSACFGLPIDDSIDGIFETIRKSAIIFKTGGGVGYNFSNIRPKNDMVKSTQGVSSGPLSFMNVYNEMCETIKQGSKRRGAMMGILNVNHPDILDFIVCKEKEGRLSNFNLSIGIDKDFMKALENNDEFNLINPRTKKPIQKIKARAIWNTLITLSWKNGEPAVLFFDTINKYNPTPDIGKMTLTNPCAELPLLSFESCIAYDSLIITTDGIKKIKDLVNTSGYILSNGYNHYDKIVSKGLKPIIKIKLDNGLFLECTPDHKIPLKNGQLKQAIQLEPNDIITLNTEYPFTFINSYDRKYEMYGWMHGDGWYTNKSIGISFNYKDGDKPIKELLLSYFLQEFDCINNKPMYDNNDLYQIQTIRTSAIKNAELLGFKKGKARQKELPSTFYSWNDVQQRSFIRGLFTADGSIGGKSNAQIILNTNSLLLAEQIQKYLQCLSIKSRLSSTFFKKELKRYPQYKLIITCESAKKYMKYIGFIEGSIKNNKINFNCKSYSDKDTYVKEIIDEHKTIEVFDVINVDNGNTFMANGILVHNCNLMSINISKFVKKNGKSCIDYDRLRKVVRLCVRFLDNVIDANKFPFKEIEDITRGNRKIGLGLMGWADTLILLKIPYDSEEALNLARQVMKFITEEGMQMSRELGKEKGNFPNKDKSIYKDEPFMRNATITTIAPTGSLSLIAGCSQSIEPIYSIVVRRNLEESLGKNIIEINNAIKTILEEKGLWNDSIIKGIESGQCLRLPSDMKSYIKTTHEISPEWHVKMQAAFQEHVHNSVSKTVNLPHEATIDDVENIYLMAYKMGCKGITVYRDGSRYKQLLSSVRCVECDTGATPLEGNK